MFAYPMVSNPSPSIPVFCPGERGEVNDNDGGQFGYSGGGEVRSSAGGRDLSSCVSQPKWACANCFERLPGAHHHNNDEDDDVTFGQDQQQQHHQQDYGKSGSNESKSFLEHVFPKVTLMDALNILFDVESRSTRSCVTLNKMAYSFCNKCWSTLSRLFKLYVAFVEVGRGSPSFMASVMGTHEPYQKLVGKENIGSTENGMMVGHDESFDDETDFQLPYSVLGLDMRESSSSESEGEREFGDDQNEEDFHGGMDNSENNYDEGPEHRYMTRTSTKRGKRLQYCELDDDSDPDFVLKRSRKNSKTGPFSKHSGLMSYDESDGRSFFMEGGLRDKSLRQRARRPNSQMNQEILQQSKKIRHFCDQCGNGFTKASHLKRHMIIHSSTKEKFKCKECGAGFKFKYLHEHHEAIHQQPPPSKCKLCKKKFRTEKALQLHLATEHCRDKLPTRNQQDSTDPPVKRGRGRPRKYPRPEDGGPSRRSRRSTEKRYQCPECPAKFAKTTQRKSHMNVHAERNEICTHCLAGFRTCSLLYRHYKLIHKMGEDEARQSAGLFSTDRPFIKPEVGSGEEDNWEDVDMFLQGDLDLEEEEMSNLRPRTRSSSISRRNEKRHFCEVCGKGFSRTNHLTRHLWSHGIGLEMKEKVQRSTSHSPRKPPRPPVFPDDEPGIPCPVCEKEFGTNFKLTRHLSSVHTPRVLSYQFVCDLCGKKFLEKHNVKTHMEGHRQDFPFECNICGFKTKRHHQLNRHHRMVHVGARPYLCTTCGMSFKKKQHLQDHENMHTAPGNKPFVCTHPGCGKRYRSRRNLRQHAERHTGCTFVCETCGHVFTRKDNLKVHVDTTHLGKPGRQKRVKVDADGAVIPKARRPRKAEVIPSTPTPAPSPGVLNLTQGIHSVALGSSAISEASVDSMISAVSNDHSHSSHHHQPVSSSSLLNFNNDLAFFNSVPVPGHLSGHSQALHSGVIQGGRIPYGQFMYPPPSS